MKAAELGLDPEAQAVAEEFESVFPSAVFTSGKRDIAEQAHDMAVNELESPGWLLATYKDSAPKRALLDALSMYDGEKTIDTISYLFVGVLEMFTPEELELLSEHLGGMAFDVKPRWDAIGTAMLEWLIAKAAAIGAVFLKKEGKLTRWHFQLRRPAAT